MLFRSVCSLSGSLKFGKSIRAHIEELSTDMKFDSVYEGDTLHAPTQTGDVPTIASVKLP